jgi:hypothetical protein
MTTERLNLNLYNSNHINSYCLKQFAQCRMGSLHERSVTRIITILLYREEIVYCEHVTHTYTNMFPELDYSDINRRTGGR